MVTAAELIAAARNSRIKKVTILGREFCLRKFSSDVVMAISRRAREGEPFTVADWLEQGVCNEDDSPFFTAEQAAEYAKIDGLVAVRIVDELASLNGYGGDDTEKN